MQRIWRCSWRSGFDGSWRLETTSWFEWDLWKCCSGNSIAAVFCCVMVCIVFCLMIRVWIIPYEGRLRLWNCYKHYFLTPEFLATPFTPQLIIIKLQVALLVQIAVHYDGVFYEFVPWNGVVKWEIAQWGCWSMSAENETHKVVDWKLHIFHVMLADVELPYILSG